ncbi:MAG: alpha/beta fold hydrolase [Dehalococcoidia bacterium]
MAQHAERMVSLRQGKCNVQLVEGGTGPNLLFLHGAGGFTGWTPFLDRLAQDYHVYAPAHPGVSRSDGLEQLDDLWDLVLFYDELAQELGLATTYILGHSYGGMLAAELAAHCPERVSRLVLVGSLGVWLEQTPLPDIFALTPSERARLLWHDPESEVARAYLAVPEDPAAKMEADLDRTQTLASIGKFIWPIPDRGLTKRAHRITMPTLLLWGDSDGLVPPAYGEAFRQLLPQASLKTIGQCGHLPQVERPEEFYAAVREFLPG